MADKPTMSPWAWSTNEEDFYGADCEETAREEAKESLNANSNPGEERSYWIGESAHPLDVIAFKDRPLRVGESIFEQINEWAFDEIGGDDAALDMDNQDLIGLGHIILRYIRENAKVQRFGLKNITKHTHITTGD